MINWKMMSHPLNWVTFVLMVVIAGAIGHMLLTYFGFEPATAGTAKKSAWASQPAGLSPGQVASGAIDPQYAPIPSMSTGYQNV
jgi:hypothetical protein